MALFALVAVGAIAQAVLQPAVANRRASRRIASQHRAQSVAEHAIAEVLATRPRRFWRELTPRFPADIPVAVSSAPGAAVARMEVIRLDSTVYSIAVGVSVPSFDVPVTARRSVLVEWRTDSAIVPAAIVAGGDVSLGADTQIGRAEDCIQGADSTAEVLVGPDAMVRRGATLTEEGVRRDPAAVAAATYLRPGGIALDAILAEPTITLPGGYVVAPAPVVEGDRCIEGPANWGTLAEEGEPAAPCIAHAPAVVAEGDLRIQGGEGRGTLIVKGRLSIAGAFRFAGMIVALGGVETLDGSMLLTGALFVPPGASVMLGGGGTVILASRCALESAAQAATRLHVVPLRGWWR